MYQHPMHVFVFSKLYKCVETNAMETQMSDAGHATEEVTSRTHMHVYMHLTYTSLYAYTYTYVHKQIEVQVTLSKPLIQILTSPSHVFSGKLW